MAIPVALPEAREKLQRTCHQRDRATQSVQRKRYAPVHEVVDLRGKRRVRQQVTKRFEPIRKREDCEYDPQDFRQASHIDLFSR